MNGTIAAMIVLASFVADGAVARDFDTTSRQHAANSGGPPPSGTIYHFGSSASKQTIPAVRAPAPPAIQPPPQPPVTSPPPARRLEPLGSPGFGIQQNKGER
ncbi:MAG TPA: hypothetical protein VJ692_05365 [Nitrospiraceae bacterium]|nr:hypothetical protein [Nitrospiraceae bacterium]